MVQGNSTIAQRNSSGYLHASYFNGTGTFSTSGADSGMGRFTGTNGSDTYGRSYSATGARALLNVENGATADQTAAQILAALKTVDVNGTAGINAGTFDALGSGSFLRSDAANTGALRFNTTEYDFTSTYNPSQQGTPMSIRLWDHYTQTSAPATYGQLLDLYGRSGHWRHQFHMLGTDTRFRYGTYPLATAGWSSWYTQWHSGNDGSGTGLDADLLDGQHGSYYAPASSIPSVGNGTLTINTSGSASGGGTFTANQSGNTTISISATDTTANQTITLSGAVTGSGTTSIVTTNPYQTSVSFSTNGPDSSMEYSQAASVTDTKIAPSTDWYNSIRMGHGDPYSYYGNTMAMKMTGTGSGTLYTQVISNNTAGGWNKYWHTGNDGSTSGLDADLLDGNHASAFLGVSAKAADSNLLDGIDSTYFNRGDQGYGVMVGTSGWNMNDLFTTRNRAGFFDVWSGTNFPPSTSHVHGMQVRHNSSAHYGWQLAGQYAQNKLWHRQVSNGTFGAWNQQWGSGNDGAGSGLDADLLDGNHASAFMLAGAAPNAHTHAYLPLAGGTLTGGLSGTTADFSGKVDFQGTAAIEGGTAGSGYGLFKGYSANYNHFMASRGIVTGSTASPTFNGGHQMTFVEYVANAADGFRFKSSNTGTYAEIAYINRVGISTIGTVTATGGNSTNWNTAYGWGNHASGGYLTAETVSSTNAVTITGTKYFKPAGTVASPLVGGGNASLQAYSVGGNYAAYMAFHRSGHYAINWGLDTSNNMILGGWSASTTVPRMTITTGTGLISSAGQGNLWGISNDGSGSGLDADLLDGLNLHNTQGTQNGANTVLRTQVNGYTMLGWINTTSGVASGAPTRIYCSQDSYIRYYTPASLAPYMENCASAVQIYTTQTAGTAGVHYPTFVSVNASGNKSLKYDPGMMYDPSTNILGDVNFKFKGTLTGSLVGNASTASSAPNASNLNTAYGVTAGAGNGLKFWNGSDAYKISMGTTAEYKYGPVTDYSIKTTIDSNSSTRGFTWGTNGAVPIAALNVGNGNMQIAGTFTGTRLFTSDGTNTISTYVSGSYNQIASIGSAAGGARDLRFNLGQSGTIMTINANKVQMHQPLLLDGAANTAQTSSNIISTQASDSSGATRYHLSFTKANGTTTLGRITTNNFSTTYTTSSDYRLKEDLVEITGATAKVLSIPTRNFRWIGSDVRTDGFLAHELATIVPDAVVGEKDGMTTPTLYLEGEELPEGVSVGDIKVASVPDYQSIDQSKLVPLLVKTIQELEARITALENA
jgi:hypothetical protein